MSAVPPPSSGNRFHVSVLSTYSSDSTPSLLVTFQNQRYLFNTPEAISRIALQSKVGLRKVGNVFLGSIDESIGLPGFILSSVEAGNNKIEIVGPVGVDHFLASCRFFTRREKLSLKVSSPSRLATQEPGSVMLPPPILSDENLNVYAFAIRSSAPLTTRNGHDSTSAPTLKRKRSRSGSPRRSRSPSPVPGLSTNAGSAAFDPTSPSFQPSRLEGAQADRWRGMVIRDMFRGNAFEPSDPQACTAGATAERKERKGHSPAYLPQPLPPFSGGQEAICYLAVGPQQQGRFLPAEAIKRGIKEGKNFARLKNGERVWVPTASAADAAQSVIEPTHLEENRKKESRKERTIRLQEEKKRQQAFEASIIDGEGEGYWVTPEECMGPGQNASAFLVLNIPSPAYLSSLEMQMSPALLDQAQLGGSTELCTVFYLVGRGVVSDARFQRYLQTLKSSLAPEVSHLITSADHVDNGKDEITFGPAALLNLRLSKLDSEVFPIPKYTFTEQFDGSKTLGVSTLMANSHFASSDSLSQTASAPVGGEIRSFNFAIPSAAADMEASRLKGAEKTDEVQARGKSAWESYLSMVRPIQKVVHDEYESRARAVVDQDSREALESRLKVTPLGTGSAIPSKYRNVSSTLIHLPTDVHGGSDNEEYIFLDAGEGTWGQLARRFGRKAAEDVIARTKMIFISHMHQDHHAGLSTLLKKRAQLDPPPLHPLTIVAPSNARIYVYEQHQLFDLGLDSKSDVRFIDNHHLEPGKSPLGNSRGERAYTEVLKILGLETIVAVPVLHRCRAWGAVITHKSGWRIVFSGDTMPCEDLVLHGQDASVLVHEATIEDGLPLVAQAKGHSTFAQAIDVATRMRARHLLLTHFSARYPKLPPVSSQHETLDSRGPVIATAFDLMTLQLSDFWKMERYREALDCLLGWDEPDQSKEATVCAQQAGIEAAQ
ncbi:tRNase Z [Sporobolomyces koalae]|uniref:tRNase Z n=1 Tax=Sporobolomyces koalae TaxID=500713 RepID=UPI00317DFF59